MKKEALLSVRDLSVAIQTRIAGGIKKILADKPKSTSCPPSILMLITYLAMHRRISKNPDAQSER